MEGIKLDEKDFPTYFYELRIKSGFTSQRRLAEAAGVSNGTIARIEDGSQHPSPETLKKVARCLDVSFNELMERAGYRDYEETVYDVDDPYYYMNRGKYYDRIGVVGESAPPPYDAERELSEDDLEVLNKIKELADSYNMDLSDPKTLQALKDALDLIKRVRGE